MPSSGLDSEPSLCVERERRGNGVCVCEYVCLTICASESMCLCVWYGCCSQKCNGPTLCFPAPVWLMFWLLIPGLVLQFSAFWSVIVMYIIDYSPVVVFFLQFLVPVYLNTFQINRSTLGYSSCYYCGFLGMNWSDIQVLERLFGLTLLPSLISVRVNLRTSCFFKSLVICLTLQYKLPAWVLICIVLYVILPWC